MNNPSPAIHSEAAPARLAELRGKLARRAAESAGTLAALFGSAQIFEPLSGRWHAATVGARLAKGMRVRVADGRALARLEDGSDVWIAAGGELDLSEWALATRTLRLAAGRILALVAKGNGPFRTLAGGGEIIVTGTAFEATARGQELSVEVLHGSVIVANPLGRASATRGRRIAADALTAPRAERSNGGAARWAGDITTSESNAAVAHAFRATRQAIDPNTRKEISPMRKKLVAGAALMIALALFLAWMRPAMLGMESTGQFTATYIAEDGTKYKMDASDPKDVADTLAKLPPERAEAVRQQIDEAAKRRADEIARFGAFADRSSDVVMNFSADSNDPWEQLISGESEAALKSYRDMLAKGVDHAKAKSAAERGFEDSLRAQRKSMPGFDDAKVQVRAEITGDGPNAIMNIRTSTSRYSADGNPDGVSAEAIAAEQAAHDGIDEDADPDAPRK